MIILKNVLNQKLTRNKYSQAYAAMENKKY